MSDNRNLYRKNIYMPLIIIVDQTMFIMLEIQNVDAIMKVIMLTKKWEDIVKKLFKENE